MIRDYMYTIFFIQTLNWQLQWVRVMSLFNRRRFHIFLAGADVLASLPDCLFVCCERYEVKCSIYFFFSIFNFFFQSLSLQALREKCSNSSEIIDDMTQKNPSKFVLVLECKNPRKVFFLPFFHFNMIRKNVYDAKHSIFFSSSSLILNLFLLCKHLKKTGRAAAFSPYSNEFSKKQSQMTDMRASFL